MRTMVVWEKTAPCRIQVNQTCHTVSSWYTPANHRQDQIHHDWNNTADPDMQKAQVYSKRQRVITRVMVLSSVAKMYISVELDCWGSWLRRFCNTNYSWSSNQHMDPVVLQLLQIYSWIPVNDPPLQVAVSFGQIGLISCPVPAIWKIVTLKEGITGRGKQDIGELIRRNSNTIAIKRQGNFIVIPAKTTVSKIRSHAVTGMHFLHCQLEREKTKTKKKNRVKFSFNRFKFEWQNTQNTTGGETKRISCLQNEFRNRFVCHEKFFFEINNEWLQFIFAIAIYNLHFIQQKLFIDHSGTNSHKWILNKYYVKSIWGYRLFKWIEWKKLKIAAKKFLNWINWKISFVYY